jgi:hypothetical protein
MTASSNLEKMNYLLRQCEVIFQNTNCNCVARYVPKSSDQFNVADPQRKKLGSAKRSQEKTNHWNGGLT